MSSEQEQPEPKPEPEPKPKPKSGGRVQGLLTALGVLGANLALTVLFYWDALASAGRRVVGAENTETWTFLWGHFWMAQSITEEGRLPLKTDLLAFPQGGTLWLKDPLWALALLPVQLTAGLPLASTLAQMFQLTLGGVAVYLLARLLGAGRWVSLIGSLTFCACPHLLGEAYNGNAEALNGGMCALWLWAMLRAARHATLRRPWSALWAGLALATLLISNQYYGLAMFVVSGPVLVVGIMHWRKERTWWHQALAVAAGVAIGAAICAYPLWLLHTSTRAWDSLTVLNEGPTLLEPPYVSDLKHVVAPLSELTLLERRPPPFQDLVYPGLGLLALALLSPLFARRWGGFRWLWPAMGVIFVVLSLGPVLAIDGEMIQSGGRHVFLPWHYLEELPLFGQMSLAHRMAVPAGLFLTMAAIMTLDTVSRFLWRTRLKWSAPVLMAIIGAGLITEVLLYPPYQIPLATVHAAPAAHASLLARIPGKGCVLNLPLLLGHNQFRRYYLWQATHGKPMAASMRHGESPPLVEGDPWLEEMAKFLKEETDYLPVADPKVRARLAKRGVEHVVLHTRFWTHQLDDKNLETWIRIMTKTFGEGVKLPDATIVYALKPDGPEKVQRLAKQLWPSFNPNDPLPVYDPNQDEVMEPDQH